jgi:serine phosphatase RsbU (regulator of sigma subunit)
MQPALDEAQIGGDFCDVFPLDKGVYAIVVGDVSGKGLAAAAQLATVRNSLRTALYLDHDVARACTGINNIMTTHELLTGFVTVFVAVYDAAESSLNYVCCGHEPPLLRRSECSGVDVLSTTGPPLGVIENVTYEQQRVALLPGDLLLLYTDGLSEAGPSRNELLQTAGLVRIMQSIDAKAKVEEIASNILAEVSAHARGVLRDDVCVLLARRQT